MRRPFARKPPAPRHRSGGSSRVPLAKDAFRRELAALGAEQPDSLTAAGQRVLSDQATMLRRLIQPWQIRAFGYYDLLGEIKFASQFYSRSLANLELYVAYENDEGELVPVTRTKEADPDGEMPGWDQADAVKALDALARVKDPGGGGRSGLLAAYGRLMFLVGEAILFVTMNEATRIEQWEMLSTDEIRLNDGLYTRFMAPSLNATQFRPAPDDQFELVAVSQDATDEEIANAGMTVDGLPEAVAYRLWKRHPRFSALSDSTMFGVLAICEELVLLTDTVRARATSRLAGPGVLFLDERISQKPLEPVPDEDPQEDLFFSAITEAMTTAITDQGSAAAVVPIIARVTVPEGLKLSDMVFHLQIVDPLQVYPETGLRLECIRRIAIGLDMPAEILEGIATNTSHWGSWMVDETAWKSHLQPIAKQLVDDLTSAYLGPYLQSVGVAEWQRFTVAYDASAIINHPDRTKDAKELHDRGALSDEALRESAGFDEDDKPTDEQHNEWLGIKLRDSNVALNGEPSEAGATGAPPPEPDDGGAAQASEVDKVPPDPPPESESVLGSALAVARIEGASQMALLRIREAAGARLRTASRRDSEAEALIDGVHARDVAWTLGAARVRALLGGPKEAELVGSARELVLDSLRMIGVTDPDVAAAVAETIERHAARTLYEERPVLNGGFPEYVKGLLAAAKGT